MFQRKQCAWQKESKVWRKKLGKLNQLLEKRPDKFVKGLEQVSMCASTDFEIGKG